MQSNLHKTKVSFWLDRDIITKFNKYHPMHGSLTKIMGLLLKRHVESMERKAKETIDELEEGNA